MSSKKNIRKVALSTMAASAAVVAVAPAVSAAEETTFPDVQKGSTHYEAIMALTKAGVINGYPNGQFGTWDNVTRSQVASIFKRALDLKVPANKEEVLKGYSDVNAKSPNSDDIAAVIAAGIFEGTQGKFEQWKDLTREQMASVIVRAFDLAKYNADKEKVEINLDKVSKSHKDNVQILANFGITDQLKDFRPFEKISRGAFATFTDRTQTVVKEEEAKRAVPTVASATAVASNKIELKGENLQKLASDAVTVADQKISYVKASEDGKTAEVALEGYLTPGAEYNVSVKQGEETKEFKVKYVLETSTVSVDAKTYDDDTKGQYVSFKVNGREGSVRDLQLNGYTVKFAAVNEAGTDATSTLFANTTTGELNTTGLNVGEEYKVQLTVSKASDVIVSEQATIKIENFDVIAASIDSLEFTNTTAGNIVQKAASNTLVAGESADLTKLQAKQNSTTNTLEQGNSKTEIVDALNAGVLKLKTSNPSVVSVDNATGTITANGKGQATVTVTYGNISKAVNFTVADEARKADRVSASNVTAFKGTAKSVDVTVYDQYGDVLSGKTLTAVSSDTSIVDITTPLTATDAKGEATVGVTAQKDSGSATITFKDGSKTLKGAFVAKASNVTGVNTAKLEIKSPSAADKAAGQSEDATVDLYTPNKDSYVVYQLQGYTAENVKAGAQNLDDYVVNFDTDTVDVIGLSSTGTDVALTTNAAGETTFGAGTVAAKVTAKKAGATDFAISKDAKTQKARVTVVDNAPVISGIKFNNVPTVTTVGKTVNYETVLNLVKQQKDSIIKDNITLSQPNSSPIRINDTVGTPNGTIYIDVNGDGELTTGEPVLGELTLTSTSNGEGKNTLGTVGDFKAGYTTKNSDKGNLLFKVSEQNPTGTVAKQYGATSVEVNVPN